VQKGLDDGVILGIGEGYHTEPPFSELRFS
jgi:hypothetical protein